MRILLVIDNLSTGGAQRQIVNLAVGLACNGHHVGMFTYAPGDLLAKPLADHSIPVYFHKKTSRFSPNVIFALRHCIRKYDYELVHSFLNTPNFYNIAASRISGIRAPKVIVSERSCDVPRTGNQLEYWIRFFYLFADQVVINSRHQTANFGRKYPWLKVRITTIYNGYDLDIFKPAAQESSHTPLHLLAIASVSSFKNGLCLVRALKILKDRYGYSPCVDWIGHRRMAGERYRYLQQMESEIQAARLEGQWNWLGQRTDVIDQIHQHDVLVHPSYGEGLPNVVCEALACGKPVIVSDTLDHPYLVQHGETGYLFDWRDPADLAEKIWQFGNLSLEKRSRMANEARSFAEKTISLDRFINAYELMFNKLMRS